MSSNGGDDIDDLIRELRETNKNLNTVTQQLDRLINSIIRGAREQEEDDGTRVIDHWDEGVMPSGSAKTPEEYIRLRSKNARSDEINAPRTHSSVDDRVEFYFQVYIRWGEHLQKIYNSLNKEEWKRFVQKLAIGYGAREELVEKVNPGPTMFGIMVIDGDVEVFKSSTHMNFLEVYGEHWFSPSFNIPGVDVEGAPNAPWGALGIERGEVNPIVGELSPDDINNDLAEALPDDDKFFGLDT